MASNSIKYKILSLAAIAFLSVGFSFASVEENDEYSEMDRFSINVYCKIASIPFFWFNNHKCAKVEPIVDLGILKSNIKSNAFGVEGESKKSKMNFESISEIKTKKEIVFGEESSKISDLKKVNPVLDIEKSSFFATSTLHSGNIKNVTGLKGSWSIDEWGRIVAKEIVVKKLCLDDLCIDKKTLQLILNSNRSASTTAKSI